MGLAIPLKKHGDVNSFLVRIAVGGVVPEFRHKRVHLPLIRGLYEGCRKLGCTRGESSQVSESNDSVRLKVVKPILGDELVRLHRVYQKKI